MIKEIKVPSLGESISEATVGQILAVTGTIVKADAEIVELETDKVNQALYAPQAGQVSLTVKTGDVVKIGQVIGTIDSSKVQGNESSRSENSSTPKEMISSVKEEFPVSKEKIIAKESKSDVPAAKMEMKESSMPSATVFNPSSEHIIRYTKEAFLEELSSAPQTNLPSTPSSPLPVSSSKKETRRPISKIRRVIAQRLVEAQQTTAMLTTFNEVDMSAIIDLREKYKEIFAKKHGCKLGFMSFFVKAVVSALQAYPDLNSYIDDQEIVHRDYYDIGVAVGTDKGVIVPVIRDCETASFSEIEKSIENCAVKARERKLALEDLQGAGFTITNGGTYGSLLSTPILTPPQCGILGMHKIEKRPVVIEDQIVIRSMMYLALSYDHRIIDGKEAVSFLVHIKNRLEDPSRLLIDI